MRKRFLSLLLAGCMLLTSAVPALADNTNDSALPESSIETLDEREEVVDEAVTVDAEGIDLTDTSRTKDETIDGQDENIEDGEDTGDSDNAVDGKGTGGDSDDAAKDEGTGADDNIVPVEPYEISLEAHVTEIGWMDPVSSLTEGAFAGTTGRNLWMESLKIDSKGLTGITYRAHVAEIGWMDSVSADDSNAFAGTTGKALAMEAIQINITGDSAEKYDIYYRAHVTNFGWLDWAKNGESAGSAGYAYTLQALEIKVLPKGQTPEGYDEAKDAFKERFRLYQTAHVSEIGWMQTVQLGAMIGTTGRNLPMEAITLQTNGADGIGIAYSTHVSEIGWMDEVQDGAVAGTIGRALPIEAIKIRLTGEKADKYDIYYQAHVTNMGWLDWAKNGEVAGSYGLAYSLQALNIIVVEKGASAPGKTEFAYATKAALSSQGYSKTKGWLTPVGNGSVIGTTGQALSLQGLKLVLSGLENTGIKYSTHVSNIGWQNYVLDGAVAGFEGGNEHIESIKMELTGAGSRFYNIWYRVHSANLGWLDWAKNGEQAGTAKLNYAAEAIQVVVLPKSSGAPGATTRPFTDNLGGWVYINGYRRYRDVRGNILSDVSHMFNPSKKQITVDCNRGITTVYGYNSQTGKYDTPIKAFWCSVGRGGEDKTPTGTFSIYRRYPSKIMNASDGSYSVWAPYISCFYGPIYFHGVASVDNSSKYISRANWEALGTPRSSGCVRLAGIEAKWVYENCPIGTKVIVGSYSTPMDCPITNPTRYAWTGGSVGFDPTLYPNEYPN